MFTMLKLLSPRAGIARFSAQIAKFGSNRRGNVAVITALACLPMVAAVGCVIDYSDASMIKTKLQAASDAAALATVSVNSSVVTTAKAMSSSGTVSGGSTFATNFFNANLGTSPENVGYQNLTSSATVSLSGTTVTTKLTFSANVPTYFLGVLGHSTIAVNGSSSSSYSLPTYINFYLMTDVSGSMSFPATSAEQTRLESVNPDNYTLYPSGCTFACHFTGSGMCPQSEQETGVPPSAYTNTYNPSPGGYCQGFNITRLGTSTSTGGSVNWSNTPVTSCPTAGTTSCIQLRADAVGYAVTTLLSTAAAYEQVTNQYKVGLYPFIQYLYGCTSVTPCLSSNAYFPLTTNLTATGSGSINKAATNLATLLDTGVNANLGSGGTHFENAFPSMNSLITSVGTGISSSNALPYVFLITDGVDNSQTYPPFTGSDPQTFSTSLCTTLKNRGITIAILYIPYQPIQNPTSFAGNEDFNVNALIPTESNDVPNNLQSCASTNFFYTANTPADINSALLSMFQQAVSTAHITN
jgi:Flp pilus assembly protein TadG